MKKSILFLAFVLVSVLANAQQLVPDTIVDGVRYAVILGRGGEPKYFSGVSVFDEHQAIIDLNNDLRSVTIRKTVAYSSAAVGAACLIAGVEKDSKYFRGAGYACLGVGALFELLSVAPLWRDRLYMNKDGLVFRLDGSTRVHPGKEGE